jgi:hypothetical protein
MAWFAFALNHAMVLGDEGLRQGEAQASAALAAGYQWVKNAFTDVVWYARAVIDNFQFYRHPVALTRECHLPFRAGSKA